MRTKGWKRIFSFTYLQNVKSRSFKVSTAIIAVIFAVICVCVNIIPRLVMDEDESVSETPENETVKTLYVLNQTDIPDLDFSALSGTECVPIAEEDLSAKCEEIASGDKPEAALLITESEGSFYLTLYRPKNEDILSKSAVESLGEKCRQCFGDSVLISLGVDKADLALANADIYSYSEVYGEEQTSVLKEVLNMIVPMLISLILFMFIMSYAQIIAQSVAMEKTSRVIELLITSVRPLAIILGKVTGVLLVCVTQILIIGAVSGAAFMISMPFGIFASSGGGEILEEAAGAASEAAGATDWGAEIEEALPGLFNAGSIQLVILTALLGFIFYSLLAGIVGAGVSRAEDLANALQPVMLIAVVGFMLSYFPATMSEATEGGMNGLAVFARFFPISSPFALPSALLLGQMSAGETALSVGFLALMTLLAVILTAKVYENIILYSGKPLKFGQILKMAKKQK